MLTVATLFWQANAKGQPFSAVYSEAWVEKLYRGFRRNLTVPFRFVVYTDKGRSYAEPVSLRQIRSEVPSYADCIQPYEMGEPMILVGLDTVITGNIDHLAEYCLTGDVIALPRDPYHLSRACNGVALVPGGNEHVFTAWRGENDMDWMRQQEHVFIDDLWPGQVVSYKGAVEGRHLTDERIVYFHGASKPHELQHLPWIREHWA